VPEERAEPPLRSSDLVLFEGFDSFHQSKASAHPASIAPTASPASAIVASKFPVRSDADGFEAGTQSFYGGQRGRERARREAEVLSKTLRTAVTSSSSGSGYAAGTKVDGRAGGRRAAAGFEDADSG